MEKKSCPVDRGKLLIGLECCNTHCKCTSCPYLGFPCVDNIVSDSLAYIYYLEELLNAKADNPN